MASSIPDKTGKRKNDMRFDDDTTDDNLITPIDYVKNQRWIDKAHLANFLGMSLIEASKTESFVVSYGQKRSLGIRSSWRRHLFEK